MDTTQKQEEETSGELQACVADLERQLEQETAGRARAEWSLRETEMRLQAILEATVSGVLVVDTRGAVANANRRFAEIWNIPDEILQSDDDATLLRFVLDQLVDPQAFLDKVEQLYRSTEQSHDILEFKDGTILERASLPLIEEGRPNGRVWSFTDITERRRAEAALKDSEKKFRSLADSTMAEIAITSGGDRFLYANKAVLEKAGMSWEEFSKLVPHETLSPAAADEGGRAIQSAMERGEDSVRFEYPQGDRWFEVNGSRITIDGEECWIWTSFDITEHKLAQERLRLSEDRYRAIFETTGTGTIIFDNDAVITLANDELASLTGYSREEIEGKMTWMDFFTGETLERLKGYHEVRAKDPSAAPRTYEAQMVDRHNRVRDGIVTISMIPGTTQRVGSFLDMTDLKRAQQQMYRADKMAALGQIIAGVAHEINNPNNFIYFNLPILRRYIEVMRPLLESHLEQQPDLKLLNMPYDVFLADVFKLLENMQHGSQRITSIVSDLKTYVRGDEDAGLKTGAIGTVINQVMTLIGKQVRKMVRRLDVKIADDIPPVRMNTGRIEQVLINLIINAGQAADKDDSWIEVTARATADRRFVEVVVDDNGSGIPADSLEQVFEPFFTSKAREAGTGLGLSISQQIVEEHGGSVSVSSEPGGGATFTVLLPAIEPSPSSS